MDIRADRPAGSPLARAYGASDTPEQKQQLESVRKFRNVLATAEASAELVRKSGKPASEQIVVRGRDGRAALVNRSAIKRRHALTVGELAKVRKAQQAARLPVFDANGQLCGHMDPADLSDKGSIDEAVYDANGKQVGFADPDDVEPFQTLETKTPVPTSQPTSTEPTPENVQKARAQLDRAMQANPWAVEVLRRHNARRR